MLRLAVLHGLALQPLLSCTAAAAAAAAPRTSGSNRAPQPQAAAAAAGPLLSLGHGQLQHLFENGDGHYDCFRCPGAVRTHRSILVFVESRRNCSDLGSRNWGQDRFPPPENNELVLSIGMGCADTVHFQPKTKHPVLTRPISNPQNSFSAPKFWSPGRDVADKDVGRRQACEHEPIVFCFV